MKRLTSAMAAAMSKSGGQWVCVTKDVDVHVHGPFITKREAGIFALTLSSDPAGDVAIVPLEEEHALWHRPHREGHPIIGGGPNPACPYCQAEEQVQ